MKWFTYSLILILACALSFLFGYLSSRNYLSWGNKNNRTPTLARFVTPLEVKPPPDVLDKLSSVGKNFPVTTAEDGQSLLYYNDNTGDLHKIEFTNTRPQDSLLQRLRPHLTHFQWSSDKSKTLANSGEQTIFYDLVANDSKLLPEKINSPIFSPLGDKIAYLDYDPKQGSSQLVITDTTFEPSKKLLFLTPKDWSITWIDQDTLSLIYTNLNQQSLMLLDVNNGHLTRIFSTLTGLEINWSRDGRTLLYSFLDKDRGKVLAYRYRDNLDKEAELPINASVSDCLWSLTNETLFCKTTSTAQQGSEDDRFISLKLGSDPQSLRINTTSKIKAENLLLSDDEKYLFFRNAYTGNLYRLRIELE